jgi:hypothetical protein
MPGVLEEKMQFVPRHESFVPTVGGGEPFFEKQE